jgi:hypothetical protein
MIFIASVLISKNSKNPMMLKIPPHSDTISIRTRSCYSHTTSAFLCPDFSKSWRDFIVGCVISEDLMDVEQSVVRSKACGISNAILFQYEECLS